jgi:hypothetical protein
MSIIGMVATTNLRDQAYATVLVPVWALWWATIPFGGIVGGGLVVGIGLAPALLVVGDACLAATMLPTELPSWRRIERKPRPTPREPGSTWSA